MNILVLTESGEHCEESFPLNFRRMESSVFKDEYDKSQFEYCKYDNEVELYRSIDQNNPQVIFIDSDKDIKIAEKILEYYGRSCPDLVGFSAISPEHSKTFGQQMKDISRDYDYVYFKFDTQQDEQFFNYLRRKVIRYKSECGEQGLITRSGDDFLFNNKAQIHLTPDQRRFLTILFDNKEGGQKKCATWQDFCNGFEEGFLIGKCDELRSRKGSFNLNLNNKLSDIKTKLKKKFKNIAKAEGVKLEGDLISTSGENEKAKWYYENKIKASKIDISND
jgi:hypothetical protein